MFRNIVCAVALAVSASLVIGCGIYNSGPNQPDPLVLFAGDAGVACTSISIQAPEQVDKARLAVSCATALLATDSVDVKDVEACAVAAGVPMKYRALVSIVAKRIVTRTGGTVIPKDSVASEAFKAFLDTCSVALG